MTPTTEQLEIRAIRRGFHVCSANAGTGKTHSVAELLADCYLEEESMRMKQLRLPPGGHLTGQHQEDLLRQVRAVSFTVDAASELNERIWKNLSRVGVEIPIQHGKPYRISRTMDSLINGWLRKPTVLASLLKVEPDLGIAMRLRHAQFTPSNQRILAQRGRGDIELAMWRGWGWIGEEELAAMIFDVTVAREGKHPCGLDSETWEEELKDWVGSLHDLAENEHSIPLEQFWKPKLDQWRAYQARMKQIERDLKNGRLHTKPGYEALIMELSEWRPHEKKRREVAACYDIARARGYHPVRQHERLASMPVLDELCACESIDSWVHLHELCFRYYREKLRFGVLDHSDFLVAFVDAVRASPFLLEKETEYPRMGIRAKYMVFDEFQDNNPFQTETVRLLCAKQSVPFMVIAVGDVKQGIYGFRGACSYGFGQVLESVKQKSPENLHYLTVSFRSLQSIVELGNTVSKTLPPYKDKVHPSSTCYSEVGEVAVAQPFQCEEDEAEWVAKKVQAYLSDTTQTVMILHRNNLVDHPLGHALEPFRDNPRLSILTIHRSKGLQADVVFLCGMSAGIIPDPRTSYVQEVNLFYVAVTRPRKKLVITAAYSHKAINQDGMPELRMVGLSPFVSKIPQLARSADLAGWSDQLVKRGETYIKQAAAVHQMLVELRITALRKEWRSIFPSVPLKAGAGDEVCEEVGAAPPKCDIALRSSIFEEGGRVVQTVAKLDGVDPKLRQKLSTRFVKNGAAPALNRADFGHALREGWIRKTAGGKYEIHPSVMEKQAA